MAKKKAKARRKSSLPNRIANGLLMLLAFSRPITLLLGSFKNFGTVTQGTLDFIVNEASFGLASGNGGFDVAAGTRFYAPVAAAFILFEVKKMAMKKFRF